MDDASQRGRRDKRLLAIAKKITLDEEEVFHSMSKSIDELRPNELESEMTKAKEKSGAYVPLAVREVKAVNVSTMDIVKSLIGQSTVKKKRATVVEDLELRKLLEEKARRIRQAQKTVALIADPRNKTLYSMNIERQVMAEYKFSQVIHNLEKGATRKCNTQALVYILRDSIKSALYGCDVNIAVFSDASGNELDFISDPEYVRKERRGQSTVFECLDQGDVVLQTNTRNKKSTIGFTKGESVVYVPLLGKGGAVGVAEIHGLLTEGVTNTKSYERPSGPLRAMIEAKDYKFADNIRLWRKPAGRSGGSVDATDKTDYNKGQYQVVCGRITKVATEKNGIPFSGGARYTITWEDGLVEESLTPNDLCELFCRTPQSLGFCTRLDLDLTESLLALGHSTGEMLEQQRSRDGMNNLEKKLSNSSLKDSDLVDRALDAVITVVRGVREASIVGFSKATDEVVPLLQRHAYGCKQDKNRKYTIDEITRKVIEKNTKGDYILVADGLSMEWIALELELPLNYKWRGQKELSNYFAVMVRTKQTSENVGKLEIDIFLRLLETMTMAIECAWLREQRNKQRKELQRQIELKLVDWRRLTFPEMCYNVLSMLSLVLPSANVYIGLVSDGALTVDFVASTPSSGMTGKSLKAHEGAAMPIVKSLETLIVRPADLLKHKYITLGSLCSVAYGKKAFDGKISKVHGHGKYDVIYLDKGDKEIGVDIGRITPNNLAFRLKYFGEVDLPYVCVPVRNRDKGVGVIGLDGVNKVPKAAYETQPEGGLLKFLEVVGRVIGSTVDIQRKKTSLKVLSTAVNNLNSDTQQILEAAISCIKATIFHVEGMVAGRITYEDDSKRAFSQIVRFGGDAPELEWSLGQYNPHKMSTKPVQRRGDKVVLMLLKLRALLGGEGKLYAIGIISAQPIPDTDVEFLEILQKVVMSSLQRMDNRDAQGETKTVALKEIAAMCKHYESMSRETLFAKVVSKVTECYFAANMYVGKLEFHSKEIRYYLASKKSKMNGNVLKRTNKLGISFRALDSCTRLGISQSSVLADKLFYFGKKEEFQFPYVAIPLVVHVDSVIGILAGDACDDAMNDSESMEEIVDFFGKVGSYLSPAVRAYDIQATREELQRITAEAATSKEGFRGLKKALLTTLPYASRVAEVAFEALDAGVVASAKSKMPLVAKEDYLFLMQVIRAELRSPVITNATITFTWQARPVWKAKLKSSGDVDSTPFSIIIPKGTDVDIINLQVALVGTIDGLVRDIVKTSIKLRYMVNAPQYVVEHLLNHVGVKNYHAASYQMISKMFNPKQTIAFCIDEIYVKDLMKGKDSAVHTYVSVKWNDSEVLRTAKVKGAEDSNWKRLKLDLVLTSKDICDKDFLVLEVWDEDFFGRGVFHGMIDMSRFSLEQEILATKAKWHPLVPNSTLTEQQQKFVGGSIKVTGSKLIAKEMNTAQMLEQLDTAKVTTQSSDEVVDDNEYHMCELKVICARDLMSNKNWKSALTNPYVVVSFNGEELGRTGAVNDSLDPTWDDEIFTIRAPEVAALEGCVLALDLYSLNTSGDDNPMGRVTLTGKGLVNFIFGHQLKKQWFDVGKNGDVPLDQSHVQGELQLSGRPQAVAVSGAEEEAKELGFLSMNALAVSDFKKERPNDRSISVTTYFNDRIVHETGLAEGQCDFLFGAEDGRFRYPNNKALFQCDMRVEVHEINSKGSKTLAGSVLFDGQAIGRLLGQKGLKAMWLPVISANKKGAPDTKIGELRIRGGPYGAAELNDDDGRVLWLDILAASSLPSHTKPHAQKEIRCNTLCKVYWNKKVAGQTKCVGNSYHPIWEKQRLLLRTPRIEKVADSLQLCDLRIEVVHLDDKKSTVIGNVTLQGLDLVRLAEGGFSRVKWCPIMGDHAGLTNVPCGSLKVKLGFADTPVDPAFKTDEVRLDVLGASGLAKCDRFRSTNPYAVVEWNGEEFARTLTVKGTSSPSYDKESFILRVPEGQALSRQVLNVSFYDNNYKSASDFLGCIILEADSLTDFVAKRAPVQFSLTASPDRLLEENSFAQGSVQLRAGMVEVANESIVSFIDAIGWIRSGVKVGKANAYGKGSDPYCIVYRTSRAEGGEEEEIHRTKVVSQTLNPKFTNEKFVFRVPADDDWSGMTLRVEMWHLGGDFLGQVTVKGGQLRFLLNKFDKNALMPTIFELEESVHLPKKVQGLVQGQLVLCGGMKAHFDAHAAEEGYSDAVAEIGVEEEKEEDVQPLNVEQKLGLLKRQGSVMLSRQASSIGESLGGMFAKKDKSVRGLGLVIEENAPLVAPVDETGSEATVFIYAAKDLSKVGFMTSPDAFCVVKWNGRDVLHTPVCKATTNPVWQDEKVAVRLAAGDNPIESRLLVEVWHLGKSADGQNDFLGQVSVEGEELGALFKAGGEQKKHPLQSSSSLSPRSNKLATRGSLVLGATTAEVKEKVALFQVIEDPNQRPLKFDLNVTSASGLAKSNYFSGNCDPYVSIFWPDADTLLGSTSVVKNSLDPVFDNEVFAIEKPRGVTIRECTLRVALYNKNTMKKDDFLGEVLLDKDSLIDWINGSMDVSFPLRGSNHEKANQHGVQGAVSIGMKQVTAADNPAMFDLSLPIPPEYKELELSILAASNLAKANAFGNSDPFCIVRWDSVEIGKTTVVEDTLDPIWEDEQVFILRAQKTLGASEDVRQKVVARKEKARLRRQAEIRQAIADGDEDAASMAVSDIQEKELEHVLTIDVYDYNRLKAGVFLGSVELRGAELHDFAAGTGVTRRWFTLGTTKRLKAKDQDKAQGRVQLMLAPRSASDDTASAKEIDVEVCAARGLAKADMFGSSDPFVKVRWNNKQAGKTTVVRNSLNPTWKDQVFTLKIPPSMKLAECELYLEIWDWNIAGSTDFLGGITVTTEGLLNLVEKRSFVPHWLKLGKSEYLSASLQKLVQGEIQIKCGYTGADRNTEDSEVQYEVSVLGAAGLARADMFGLADPFAIVFWNSREIGRTPYATKTLNPEWSEQTVTITLHKADSVAANTLKIDVYDYKLLGRGAFLGCVVLKGSDLEELFDLQEETRFRTLDLAKDVKLDDKLQKLVQGKLDISVRRVSDDQGSDGAPLVPVSWYDEIDKAAGLPVLEVRILSCSRLPITKQLLNRTDPFCAVRWNGEEAGATPAGSGANPEWKDQVFVLPLPVNAEQAAPELLLEVWDQDTLSKGDFLGFVRLSFASVVYLHDGTFTLPLEARDRSQYVRGSITFSLSFMFPFWDSLRTHMAKKMTRCLRVLSARDLPMLNGLPPSTRCVVHYGGANKAKSMIVKSNVAPVWPQTQVEEVLDLQHPLEITLLVYHADTEGRREVCIGQVSVPFEILVRPSAEGVDLPLETPVRKAPAKYKFTTSGAVRVLVTAGLLNDSVLPWSHSYNLPVSSLVVHDLNAARRQSKEELQYDGEPLSDAQLAWLGSCHDLSSPLVLSSRKEWLVVPLKDLGMQVGKNAMDFVGTRPGQRFALCIERPLDRLGVSDVAMIEEIRHIVQHFVIKMRRKEVFGKLRELLLKKYTAALGEYTKSEDFDPLVLHKWLVQAVKACFPGATVYTATIAEDVKSLVGTIHESDGSTREVTWHQGQGCEWEFTGRYFPRSLLIKGPKDLLRSGKDNKRVLTTHKPFANTNTPRLIVPFSCGDASMGFFSVENFSVFNGGLAEEPLVGEPDVRKWCESIGTKLGEAMYMGREKFALRNIEAYVMGYASTHTGLVMEILKCCIKVLQGCKMIEVWSISKNYDISSLAVYFPKSKTPSGRMVAARVVVRKLARKEEKAAVVGADGNAMAVAEIRTPPKHFVCGLRYDNTEHSLLLTESPTDQDLYLSGEYKILISNERTLVVTVYEVDESMRVQQEYSGRVSLITFQESEAKTTLSLPRAMFSHFEAELTFAWPQIAAEGIVSFDIKTIRAFNLTIKSARELTQLQEGKTYDLFAEVFFGTSKIGKTFVKKNTVTPVWNESYTIPFDGKKLPLTIELYDMGLLGKGNFRGVVQIPFDQLVIPPPTEVEYPLQHKLGMNAKKQSAVGGKMTIEFSMDVVARKPASEDEVGFSKLIAIPRQILQMSNPAVKLTVLNCTGLAKANLFGGSSDPFVMLFLGNSTEPIAKTKVVDNSLDPVFNETFTVSLDIDMKSATATVDDFPKIRLEVYDFNNIAAGEFLGCCELTPQFYFTKKGGDFPLGPSKKLSDKKNKLAQGHISILVELVDNIASIENQEFIYKRYDTFKTLPGSHFLEVHILRGTGLMSANGFGGKSDPFVMVRWNEKMWGETTTKKDTLDPVWNDQKFLVNLTSGGSRVADLVIEVWDKNFFTQGEFMGEVRIRGEELLHAVEGSQEVQLSNRPGRFKGRIKGTLSFKLIERFQPQCVRCKPKEYNEDKLVDQSLSPMPLKVIRDPEQEMRRQKLEKHQLPGILAKTKQQMSTYLNNPFERTGLISELHYGQIVASCQRTGHTILKSDASEIFCAPTTYTEGDNPELLYVVSRYAVGYLSKRDADFLVKVKGILVQGISTVGQRETRAAARRAFETNMRRDLGVISSTDADELLITCMLEVEQALNCPTRIYTLDPKDGKTFAEAFLDASSVTEADRGPREFVTMASRLARHGLILQFYRGSMSLIDPSWTDVSQMAVVSMESMSNSLENAEGRGFCAKVLKLATAYMTEGCFVVPLIAPGESYLGTLLVRNINAIPHAIYRYYPIGAAAPTRSDRKSYVDLKAPEDGVSSAVASIPYKLGKILYSVRLNSAVKKLKVYQITAKTSVTDILRFAIRMLITAVPAIREVSVWAVDMSRGGDVLLKSRVMSTKGLKLPPFLSKRFSPEKFEGTENAEAVQLSLRELESPSIIAGFFGEEDPHNLMSTPLAKAEKKVFDLDKSKDTYKQETASTAADPQYRRNATSSMADTLMAAQSAFVKFQETMVSEFTTGIPNALFKVTKETLNAASPTQPVGDTKEASIAHDIDSDSDNSSENSSDSNHDDDLTISAKVKRTYSKRIIDSEIISTIRLEVRRCLVDLRLKSFRVITGHILASVGTDSVSSGMFDTLFDPEYAKKKKEEKEEKRLRALDRWKEHSEKREKEREEKRRVLEEARKTKEEESKAKNKRGKKEIVVVVPEDDNIKEEFNLEKFNSDSSEEDEGALKSKNSLQKAPSQAIVGSSRVPVPPKLVQKAKLSGTSSIDTSDGDNPKVGRAEPPKAPPPPGRPAAEKESDSTPKTAKLDRKYFLTVGTHGIGSETGWGISGPILQSAVESIANWVDASIAKSEVERLEIQKAESNRQ